MTLPDTSEKCPQCGKPLAVTQSFGSWCPACDWGVVKADEEPTGFFRPRVNRWAARQEEALFQQVSGTTIRPPGWSFSRFTSYVVAICVHAFFIALVVLAAWLIVILHNVVSVFLGLCVLLLAFELRPRLGSFRQLKDAKHRADAPVLFAVLDQVAAAVGAKPVHAVAASASWNASYSAAGWRRRRVVTLGLPLWDALPADQKIAVLGHEFAHGVNGDARHGTIVGTSIATLTRLYGALQPGPRLRGKSREIALAEVSFPSFSGRWRQ
jgi:Zn-dependent protease with chaperone function